VSNDNFPESFGIFFRGDYSDPVAESLWIPAFAKLALCITFHFPPGGNPAHG
jgi:hypothetical protein